MGRIHLFEFEDQEWLPAFLRNYMTDFLRYLSYKAQIYKPIIPIIKKGLSRANTNQIIDLGSGGGGGLICINTSLKKEFPDLKITMTDYYPNIPAFESIKLKAANLEYITTSIDARHVPKSLKGLRTLFLLFHHFRPPDAQQILQDAVDNKCAIAIFEAQQRSLASIIAMILSPISVLLTTPFIRPFKIGRLVFTYLIPLVPIFVLWDGVISSLRTYSIMEMNNFVKTLDKRKSFDWEINKVRSGPGFILYLLGTPRDS